MADRGIRLFAFPWMAVLFFTGSIQAWSNPFRPETLDGSRDLQKLTLEVSYNREHKLADWVFYSLSSFELQNCFSRSGSFRQDPALPEEESASLDDYRGSGYDRGHLSPVADNKWSREAMAETFLLSNVIPQPPSFNRGIWSQLEELVRAWAMKEEGLWVATGGVLKRGLPTIGPNRISVPESFFKVLVTKGPNPKALALMLPGSASGNLSSFALSIHSLEEITGLNFMAGIEGRERRRLEEGVNTTQWDFRARYRAPPCRKQGFGIPSAPWLARQD
jgi:endonuclease G, mitochondrial